MAVGARGQGARVQLEGRRRGVHRGVAHLRRPSAAHHDERRHHHAVRRVLRRGPLEPHDHAGRRSQRARHSRGRRRRDPPQHAVRATRPVVPPGRTVRGVARRRDAQRSSPSAPGATSQDLSDTEALDGIEYFLFPNFFPWGGYLTPLVYRFRPWDDDPGRCLMEVMLLDPLPVGPRPAPADAPVPRGRRAVRRRARSSGSSGRSSTRTPRRCRRVQRGMRASVRAADHALSLPGSPDPALPRAPRAATSASRATDERLIGPTERSAHPLGAALEVVADCLRSDRVHRPDDAELHARRIPHDDPAAGVVDPLTIDDGRAERLESRDLGLEIVGVDVEVDARPSGSRVLDHHPVRRRRIFEDVVVGHLRGLRGVAPSAPDQNATVSSRPRTERRS